MSSTFSNLKFEIIGNGEQSGTWGTTTNVNIGTAIEQAIVGMATLDSGDFAANICTLTLTNTNAAQDARALCLNIAAGAVSAAGTINVPAIEKPYIVINGSSFTVTVKVSGLTGVAVPSGTRTVVYNNGTDVGTQLNWLNSLTLGTALPVASGGTGVTTSTGTGNVVLSTSPTLVTPILGTPTSGTLTNATGLPLTTGVTGTLPVANGGTGATTLTANNVILGNGTSAVQVVAPSTAGNVLTSNGTTWSSTAPAFVTSANNTFTGTQTFSGTSSAIAMVLSDAAEVTTISATAATGTIAYDITTQSVLYYTSNASADWTVNFRASSGTSLNTLMTTGQSMTVAFLVTQGFTAYYNSVIQVDGTTSGVTTVWLGGTPTSGNASGIDSYRYLIIKTGNAAFTVLASVVQFKV
jgi:hypothetical protein